jgi:hypothetical protein
MKAFEQHGKCIAIALLHGMHDFFVAELLEWILGLRATPR